MAYKSEAQKAKFAELVKSGKMKSEIKESLDLESKGMKLPDRISPVKKVKSIAEMRTKAKALKK